MNMLVDPGPHLMTASLNIDDPVTAWWIGQVILRLRREIAWLSTSSGDSDRVQEMLDLIRYDHARAAFFSVDPASIYLTAHIGQACPDGQSAFASMAEQYGLNDAECFVLAAALAGRIDGALGPVFAATQNDAAKPWPTLALVQSLWDDPLEILAAQDPARPLLADGLLAEPTLALDSALVPAPGLTRYLTGTLDPKQFGLSVIEADLLQTETATRFAQPPAGLEIVALIGPAASDATTYIRRLIGNGDRACLVVDQSSALRQARQIAELSQKDLFLSATFADRDAVQTILPDLTRGTKQKSRVYLHLTDRDAAAALPKGLLGPVLNLPRTSPADRVELFREGLGAKKANAAMRRAAHAFRLEAKEITRITEGLTETTDSETLMKACRIECTLDFQGLADALEPRFSRNDLVLPKDVSAHFDEVLSAVQGSDRVQYEWGGADAFGESGIALLFAGVPGTGKTMAAQVLARELDLPIWRIDLSQVVNKYIGETEKNLKRVFDSAEKLRCILFFDEAEALFGKRTEVKDANDRFANVETGYLLQRMENFTGVAVLATNRRKDLDDAFARRLRYLIEFPMPGAAERQKIWGRVFPPGADISDLDLAFLGRQLQLSGGYIRSIAINASLQTAARGKNPKIRMEDVLIAAKRELSKLNRATGADTFGPWYQEIEELRL